jgi:hypothetical protein
MPAGNAGLQEVALVAARDTWDGLLHGVTEVVRFMRLERLFGAFHFGE